jgi:hypothetical protein
MKDCALAVAAMVKKHINIKVRMFLIYTIKIQVV